MTQKYKLEYVAKCVECKWSYSSNNELDVKTRESDHARKNNHVVMHGKTTK